MHVHVRVWCVQRTSCVSMLQIGNTCLHRCCRGGVLTTCVPVGAAELLSLPGTPVGAVCRCGSCMLSWLLSGQDLAGHQGSS